MRVVILDIDGPMIPSTWVLCHGMAAWDRIFPETTVKVVNVLCERTGARIVINSTHNTPRPDAPDIIPALIAAGVDPAHFHPDEPLTRYPDLDRGEAAADWLARHPETTDWVGYDDAVYTQAPELIWVDPDSGLTLCHLNQALERFGCRTIFIGT
jgi:hypothetical protein